jgi:hypothetical protein
MFKKHMTPLTKGGTLHKHKGKGSQMAPMPDRRQISQLAQPGQQSMNDYAKATPMAQPQPADPMEGGF